MTRADGRLAVGRLGALCEQVMLENKKNLVAFLFLEFMFSVCGLVKLGFWW